MLVVYCDNDITKKEPTFEPLKKSFNELPELMAGDEYEFSITPYHFGEGDKPRHTCTVEVVKRKFLERMGYWEVTCRADSASYFGLELELKKKVSAA